MDYDKYKITAPYPEQSNPNWQAMLESFRADEAAKMKLFHDDAIPEAGLTGHPKAEKAYSHAWQESHAYGYEAVFNKLLEIAEILL